MREELLVHRCATDVQLYAETFFPHYCTREFNAYHLDTFRNFVYGARDLREADGAPRGSAKSTLKTLVKPIHDACYGLEKFIVVISSTTPLANKKLKDIRSEVNNNSELRRFYGIRFPNKKAGESEFKVVSDCGFTYFTAIGRGSELRGIRHGEYRPTKIILDDVEHSDEVYNEKTRKKTEDWFLEDVTKAGDTGTNIELVGTVLHKDSLLAKLMRNPAYKSRLYKAIISWSDREDLWNKWREIYRNIDNQNRLTEAESFYLDNEAEMLKGTKVLWPEKESYLDHMKDMEEIGYRAFMKEKQNDPQGSEESIFEKFHFYREIEKDGKQAFQIESNGAIVYVKDLMSIAAMDPSTGQAKSNGKSMGDYTVLIGGYKDIKGRVFAHVDFTKRVSPTKYIEEIFNLWDKTKYEKLAVETNLYRNLLLPNIIDERNRRRKTSGRAEDYANMSFYDVENTENKRERIYRLEPKVNHGMILFNRALTQTFMGMIKDFPNADHDDAPDCLEMLWNLANGRYKIAAVSANVQAGR